MLLVLVYFEELQTPLRSGVGRRTHIILRPCEPIVIKVFLSACATTGGGGKETCKTKNGRLNVVVSLGAG